MTGVESKVGERVKTYRERLDLTVEALATESGVSKDVIAAIESGQAYPAIGLLVRLSRALGQRLGTFMDDQHVQDPVIVRTHERVSQGTCHKDGNSTPGLCYAPLGRGKPDRHMEPFFIDVEAGAAAPLSSHEGEEFLYVISGEALLVYGNEETILKPGDSVYYNSLVPHAVRSANGVAANLVATVFMPI